MKFSIERPIHRTIRKFHKIAEIAGARAAQRRVVFMHIPKCAGSTIISAAKSYLGSEKSGNVVLLDDFMPDQLRRDRIARAKDALFVSGHFGFETLEQVRKDAYVFTVLREPYERLRSVYGYLTALKRKNPLSEEIKSASAEVFLTSRDPAVRQWTDNMIARALAQTCDQAQLRFSDEDATTKAAVRNLQFFDHVGFVDTIEDDMPNIARATRISAIAKPGHKNSTKSHLGTKDRPEAVTPLSDEVRAATLDLVRCDLRVYEAALHARTQACRADADNDLRSPTLARAAV